MNLAKYKNLNETNKRRIAYYSIPAEVCESSDVVRQHGLVSGEVGRRMLGRDGAFPVECRFGRIVAVLKVLRFGGCIQRKDPECDATRLNRQIYKFNECAKTIIRMSSAPKSKVSALIKFAFGKIV